MDRKFQDQNGIGGVTCATLSPRSLSVGSTVFWGLEELPREGENVIRLLLRHLSGGVLLTRDEAA